VSFVPFNASRSSPEFGDPLNIDAVEIFPTIMYIDSGITMPTAVIVPPNADLSSLKWLHGY
jgi:hypothetical protein